MATDKTASKAMTAACGCKVHTADSHDARLPLLMCR